MAETLRELVVALSLDSSKVFTLISLRKQQIAKLDELVKARFVEMFGDPVKNPKKWATKCFDDVCDGIGDGLHGTPEYDDNGDYPFINGNNLIDGYIVITPATKKVSADTYKQHFIEISSNAILISINGTLGKLAYYNDEKVMLGSGSYFAGCGASGRSESIYRVPCAERKKCYFSRNERACFGGNREIGLSSQLSGAQLGKWSGWCDRCCA